MTVHRQGGSVRGGGGRGGVLHGGPGHQPRVQAPRAPPPLQVGRAQGLHQALVARREVIRGASESLILIFWFSSNTFESRNPFIFRCRGSGAEISENNQNFKHCLSHFASGIPSTIGVGQVKS